MAETKDIGRLFFQVIRVRRLSWPVHIGKTVETDPPFRKSRPLILRISLNHALVIGWWRESGWDMEEALMEAVSGWGLDPYDEEFDDETRQTIRENIAANSDDADTEWTVISALGVEA